VFVQPLIHDSESRTPTIGKVCLVDSPDKLTSMTVFFRSVEQLYTVNSELLLSLCEKLKDWSLETTTIGDVFSKYGPLFTLYSQYTDSQEFAARTITEFVEKNRDFAEFLAAASQDERCQGQNLHSLLIMPIQRVPRYHLLLQVRCASIGSTCHPVDHPDCHGLVCVAPVTQELLKQTTREFPDHPDVELVGEAVAKVKGSAQHINEVIVLRENKENLLKVRRLAVCWHHCLPLRLT
jgi:hypothetical protein